MCTIATIVGGVGFQVGGIMWVLYYTQSKIVYDHHNL